MNPLSLEILCISTRVLHLGRHERALVPRAQVTQKFTLTTLETKRHGVLPTREDLDGVVRATTAMLVKRCFPLLATFFCSTQKRVQPDRALQPDSTVCGRTTCPTAQLGKSVPFPRTQIFLQELESVSVHFQQTMRCTSPPETPPWDRKFGATTLLTKHTGW